MKEIFNVYCDESCHLENDDKNAMVLGAVWSPLESTRRIALAIRGIKEKHGLSRSFEIKWTKVSPAGLAFYLEVVRLFFDEEDLHFRAIIIPDKRKLRHAEYGQDHDTWYYKMYFEMLKWILTPSAEYRIYLDIKDTRSSAKIRKLHDVLSNNLRDFDHKVLKPIQTVRSHEVEQVQLADLLIGAVGYANRGLGTSKAKSSMVRMIEGCSGQHLNRSTPLNEMKMKLNLFRWKPDWGRDG